MAQTQLRLACLLGDRESEPLAPAAAAAMVSSAAAILAAPLYLLGLPLPMVPNRTTIECPGIAVSRETLANCKCRLSCA